MLVLALDTSTPAVTAGVARVRRPHEIVAELAERAPEGAGRPAAVGPADMVTVLAEETITDAFGHAEHLMPLVGESLERAGHGMADLTAVVVGIGPGPFTGLRVGMVTAAALGDARDIPVHGVVSHDAISRQSATGEPFLVATDARRREVYLSVYAADGSRAYGPVVTAPAAVPDLLTQQALSPVSVAGPGATLISDHVGLPLREGTRLLTGALAKCALRSLLTGAIPGPLTPLYLRRPDAAEPAGPKPVLPADEGRSR